MAATFLTFCASALLVQSAYSQCLAGSGLAGPWGGAYGLGGGLGFDGFASGCGCGGVASTGGGLIVESASPIAPVGVSVLSENVYEGGLCVGGNLPFLGTVGIEGILPTAGCGTVSYGCGNGNIGIGAEAGPIVTGITTPGSYGPGIGAIGNGLGGIAGAGFGAGLGCGAGLGYGAGLGAGCGCGGLY